MFIEIPIVVIDPEPSDVDYESLGIEEPEAPKVVISALVNLDNIGRINAVDNEEEYKTALFPVDEDQPTMRCTLSYDEIFELIRQRTGVILPSYKNLPEQIFTEEDS